MSKYEELAQLYRETRRSFRRDEEECRNFARELVFGMVDYFEWPQDQEITYIPLGEELDANNKFYALQGAMQMDAESFWHFGVELKMHETTGAYPISLILSFFIKKSGERFIVRLGPRGKEFGIPEDKQDQLEPFFDIVFRHIQDFFHKRYVRAVTNQDDQMGFIMLLQSGE